MPRAGLVLDVQSRFPPPVVTTRQSGLGTRGYTGVLASESSFKLPFWRQPSSFPCEVSRRNTSTCLRRWAVVPGGSSSPAIAAPSPTQSRRCPRGGAHRDDCPSPGVGEVRATILHVWAQKALLCSLEQEGTRAFIPLCFIPYSDVYPRA